MDSSSESYRHDCKWGDLINRRAGNGPAGLRLASVREAGLRPFWQRMNFDRTESLGETLREGPTPG